MGETTDRPWSANLRNIRMELHQLRCFLAVANLLHFSRAAEQLHMSQPALSTQIQKLEAGLGVRLFERSHQKTTLTYAGTIYREEARELLAMADGAVERAKRAAQGKIGLLRVGFISTAAAYVIPPLVAAFRKDYPDVELQLEHHLTAKQVALLANGLLDIGFLRLPLPDPGRLQTIPVHREVFKLFLPASHPLARRSVLQLTDLDGVEFVTYSRRNAPGFTAVLSKIMKDGGIRPSGTHEASDMYSLISLVSAGVGVAIAPASLMNYRMPDVAVRDIEGVRPSEIGLAHRDGIEHPVALAFKRMALAMYPCL